MNEYEEFNINPDECEHCKETYYESDTGYREDTCMLSGKGCP